MNKKCAKCDKTVYPTEEVKCLDRSWHKFCFKCETCGMTLNMKNYKGYNKKPYCNTHYPTTKFTAIADTPEMQRIAENTKIQSNISYHADFEKQKGKKTSVVTDPEITRIRQNTAIQSNIQYQNVAGKKYDMEARRPEQVMEGRRGRHNPGKISEYEPSYSAREPPPPTVDQPPQKYSYQQRNSSELNYPTGAGHQAAQVFDSERGGDARNLIVDEDLFVPGNVIVDEDLQNGQKRRQPGNISDYDPMAGYGHPGPQPVPPPMAPVGYGKPRQAPSYRAIYDYTAADDDEVSFSEGDVICNIEVIDEGWMMGLVQKSGQQGMLPSNYVEPI